MPAQLLLALGTTNRLATLPHRLTSEVASDAFSTGLDVSSTAKASAPSDLVFEVMLF